MNAKILVAAHKNVKMPVNNPIYTPVFVGAALHPNLTTDFQRDDEGDNISVKNPNFNELTAIYWAWKNVDADVIGLVHYRRYFSTSRMRSLNNVLNEDELQKLLSQAPIILPKKRHYYIETNYSHYIHAHRQEPLDEIRLILQDQYPEYVPAYDQVMKRTTAHMFNMFIMQQAYFREYCEWLFGVLNLLEDRLDTSLYSQQDARVYGYISELMMDVWLQTRGYTYVETNWIQLGKRQTVKKMVAFLQRKFSQKKEIQTHF
ncbi:DUF4422 domain-containing protein [Levilactobacillus bambusae]|uniref:Exopolysaccharide biosynthesis protein n=1 Tax=Levilactobacillus bambusae TaxID=2024736 RepID=A0A2V1MXN7_9LACO|nr:DUF4422 domain-containing protein [Levilactobacillus bambusae]PWF99768.1 exopolysaccharide biosynthesis protein [Levilactobacillus bambusae]